MADPIRVRVLRCGYAQLPENALYGSGSGVSLGRTTRQFLASSGRRVTVPVNAFLVEHPKGRVLVDCGWPRALSPNGAYDPAAVRSLLPAHLARYYRPWVPAGMTAREQLAAMGLRPEDLDAVILTHFDPDHIGALKELAGAKQIYVPEDEYFWTCRTVYRLRQPQRFYSGVPMVRFWYRGSDAGPNRWAYDLFGDGTILCVSVPGHTDGMASVLVSNGELLEHKLRFVLLTSDAAFTPRNWEQMIPPGAGFDASLQRRGLEWIRKQAAREGCLGVFTSHDPDLAPQTVEIPMLDHD